MSSCVVAMEACGSSNFWARRLQALGHDARLISPQFVKPYVKANKNDFNDAEAICEAATRPQMCYVPVKSIEQQDIQAVHRVRQHQGTSELPWSISHGVYFGSMASSFRLVSRSSVMRYLKCWKMRRCRQGLRKWLRSKPMSRPIAINKFRSRHCNTI